MHRVIYGSGHRTLITVVLAEALTHRDATAASPVRAARPFVRPLGRVFCGFFSLLLLDVSGIILLSAVMALSRR